MKLKTPLLCITFVLTVISGLQADDSSRVIDADMHHLRMGTSREWDDFPETANRSLELAIQLEQTDHELAVSIRQRDVKQLWNVVLNDKVLGQLIQDENDLTCSLAVPRDAIRAGTNRLRIVPQQPQSTVSDDILVGEIRLRGRPLVDALRESSLSVEVRDRESHELLPCRITLTTADGSLASLATDPDAQLAVRTGVVYTATGRAVMYAPAGDYILYAGRGFEYGLARTNITLQPNIHSAHELTLQREVDTAGYVACDTHIHTLTHSGHGDASLAERMVTLAGEGIELAIATDHNVHVDYEQTAQSVGVRRYFTPVVGNEVTTSVGHFNIFPVQLSALPPDASLKEWSKIFDAIYGTPDAKIAILNHARDLHTGVRPFGPKLYNWVVAEPLDGREMRFNGMELVNSGATQNDILQLPLDWMSLLNGGFKVTPVGSSDSHDVARHFVGQGRTYIKCDDRDPGKISIDESVNAFLEGRVIVSYGLLLNMRVNQQYEPGDLVPRTDTLQINLHLQAPEWIHADHSAMDARERLILGRPGNNPAR